ncbi:HDL166Wp [Eremothecium sinecaudum]|uniref:Pre-rRNA-processing protein ESF2 n=1 Tax=Eremothecium sinecaudum TaxID=45286 RepID=A0A109UZ57_9SACH|nr:HDL166Wp [Eremothecium sinecaudum]AMD20578.1 HDL166Wp [Eremothecium sinecaudum]
MSDSDNDSRDFSSDEEETSLLLNKKNNVRDVFDNEDSDIEEDEHLHDNNKNQSASANEESNTEQSASEENQDKDGETKSNEQDIAKLKTEKLKRLKKLKAAKKTKHKTGVIYLSKIPPYMKPAKLRQVLSRFGEVDRLFLKREDDTSHKQRVKSGGNKKVMFKEGWAEFIRKKDAKLCAATLNGNILGGKKGNFYHDDIINMKYLPGFKWSDLTEQIARENDIRQAKLQLDISQANKYNAEVIKNFEKSKMIENIKSKKRSEQQEQDDVEVRRTFKQRRVATNRAAAPEAQKEQSSNKLDNVLHSLF